MLFPKISIIIPVYNVEKYLPQCIDSVLAQTYKKFEVILVDDGSSDSCPAICDEYMQKDSRIRVIHQKNSGVSSARNKGIEEAKGEWITFIDSDDWVDLFFLENFHVEDTVADVAIQGLQYINHNTGEVIEYKGLDNVTIDASTDQKVIVNNDLFIQGYPVCKAYRKCFLQQNNLHFDISLSTHEDILFVLQCFVVAKQIKLVSGTLYNYRYYHSTNTLSAKVHPWKETLESSRKMLDIMKKAVEHFAITDERYLHYIYSRSIAPRIKALFDIEYDNASSYYKNITCIIKDRKDIVNYWYPKGYKYKFIKFLIFSRLNLLLCLFMVIYKKTRHK